MPREAEEQVTEHTRTLRSRVLSGSAVLLSGMGLATVINFAYNLAVARFLGPVAFGHTSAVYTVLIFVSAVTLSFQILTAKIVAQQLSPGAQALAYRGFHRWGWVAGIVVSLLLVLFRDAITDYLNLPDSTLIVLLAIGTTFYVPLGARRGYLQGICNFRFLAFNVVCEGIGRLGGSLLLMRLGFGVQGVIAANAAAVVVAYFLARPKTDGSFDADSEVPVAFREGLQAAVFFTGQVIINNCDIELVKHFFPPEPAGVYAAVAMVGRVVFVASLAVVNSMFPIAAGARSRKQRDHGVLPLSLLVVAGICLAFALGLRLAPNQIWTHLLGSQFGIVDGSHLRYLLVLYAVSAGVYAMSAVLIAYEMSHKVANTGWMQLLIGGAVIAGIYRFHSSLAEVIWVQIVMMAVLLVLVAIPFLLAPFKRRAHNARPAPFGFIRLSRRVSEDEVIAEFLKNDSHSPEFAQYLKVLDKIVSDSDVGDEDENAVRRALFNIRHGSLWRELPKNTAWFEAEVEPEDVHRLRVFPRAQWRKLALGDFGLMHVTQRIGDANGRVCVTEGFREKIDDLRHHVGQGSVAGAVLLIGQDEAGPFTILDGNHRLVAAQLTSPNAVRRFRFFCGLSPNMNQCCWYQTNAGALLRYGTNRVRYLAHDPEKELLQVLQRSGLNDIAAVQ
ncbi:MAG: hypothetical protein WBS24_04730 [Terriglobales bacterium]